MRIYAVIDTNVLVSALLRYESVPGQVMAQALTGQIIPLRSYVVTPHEMLERLNR